jgi:hypothetical protein
MGNFNDIDHNLRTVTQLLQLEMVVTLICFLIAPGRKTRALQAWLRNSAPGSVGLDLRLLPRALPPILCGDEYSWLLWLALLQSLQLSVLLREPLVQVLAFKLGKLASEQSSIALNIPPMAQNFGSPEVNHRRNLTEMAHNCPSDGGGEFAGASYWSGYKMRRRSSFRCRVAAGQSCQDNPSAGLDETSSMNFCGWGIFLRQNIKRQKGLFSR